MVYHGLMDIRLAQLALLGWLVELAVATVGERNITKQKSDCPTKCGFCLFFTFITQAADWFALSVEQKMGESQQLTGNSTVCSSSTFFQRIWGDMRQSKVFNQLTFICAVLIGWGCLHYFESLWKIFLLQQVPLTFSKESEWE